ncbi:MAG: PGF-pre-PGF domain-containing protein [Candidatus Methanoperedens sp.]|nr:PGF-pre-PGF domain-containing protein [Candidatus Methanoperedens sp.]
MNIKILFFLLMLLIPVSQAVEPSVTSYNGYVTVDSNSTPNAQVKVCVDLGEISSSTSNDRGYYFLKVPWEDAGFNQAGVKPGETLKFLVDGKLADSKVIGSKGSNILLNLSITSSSAAYVCKTTAGNTVNTAGSSGGGGGSTVSAETFENIAKQESREEMLSKDAPRTYSFSTPELPVSQIVITSNINAGLITAKVELLKARSTLLTVDAPGKVNKYLNIWVGSLGFAIPKNIKEGVIKFRVENSWITSNEITDSDLRMLKWNGIEWMSLATEKKSSDEKFTYFESKTTSFSPFAISAVTEAAAPQASPEASAAVTAVPTLIQETPTPAPTKKAPGFGVALALAGMIVVVLRKRSV